MAFGVVIGFFFFWFLLHIFCFSLFCSIFFRGFSLFFFFARIQTFCGLLLEIKMYTEYHSLSVSISSSVFVCVFAAPVPWFDNAETTKRIKVNI